MSVWHAIGQQFRNPSGIGGYLMGYLMRGLNQRANSAAIAALSIKPGDCVLELGCGPGAAIQAMSRLAQGVRVHGVDQSQVMIHQAARRNRGALKSGRVALHHGLFDNLPFDNASVDKVLAVNVAYFWQDMSQVLAEIARVLRPGGILAIYVTDASAMRHWAFAGPLTHRLFDAAQLRTAFAGSAFPAADVNIAAISAGAGVTGLVAVATRSPDRSRQDA
jgi:ubiquinone/menaquinone biosynthesis C-methylase UbiE